MALAEQTAAPDPAPAPVKRWTPKRALVTPAALEHAHGRAVAERCAALGVDVVELKANRLTGLRGVDERDTYRRAKTTLGIVVAPPSAMKLQPIPPSADFSFHLAHGCPAHCQYCYLAGSLPGPPVTRVYANLDEVLKSTGAFVGQGTITSRSKARRDEGTTFEASCYTDPLAMEHLTGGVARAIEHFGAREDAGLRFTTKFDDVASFLPLAHRGRTRARFSVNADWVAKRFEGGTANVGARLRALGRMARAGYPVGLTIAPIMPFEGWRTGYAGLLDAIGEEVRGIEGLDLTAELITHRFTVGSREVLRGWYPATALEMDEEVRTLKRTKFGGRKFVYPKEVMAELRGFFEEELGARGVRVLYFT
jgi:spore photoproduct lyase